MRTLADLIAKFSIQQTVEDKEHDERAYIINQIKVLERKPKWYHPLLDCIIEFCDVTGLHGAGHITRKSNPITDRIAWFFIVIIAISIGLTLLYISWSWGDETPTKQVINSLHDPMYLIQFPAVTICSNNRISKIKITELSNQLKFPNYTLIDFLKLFKLTMSIKGGLKDSEDKYLLFDRILKSNNYTLEKLTDIVAPNCSDLITKCTWKGESRNCEAIFQEVDTSFGKCCAFNYFGRNETKFPRNVIVRSEIFKLPQRVSASGPKSGLSILIEPKINDYFASYFSHQGLKIFFHDSYDYPDENAIVTFTPVRTEAHIQISAKQTFATNDLLRIKPSIRNCLFANERKLNYMQSYSLINCYAECRSKLIYNICGCIPETLPRNKSMKFCQAQDIPCILKNRSYYIASALPGQNILNKINQTKSKENQQRPCNCLPDCQINQYSALPFATFLDRNFSYSYKNMFKGVELTDQILLHIYFTDLLGTRYKMTSFQTWLEILASFGGLLGFVMGFSIVTIGEFIFSTFISPILNHFKV